MKAEFNSWTRLYTDYQGRRLLHLLNINSLIFLVVIFFSVTGMVKAQQMEFKKFVYKSPQTCMRGNLDQMWEGTINGLIIRDKDAKVILHLTHVDGLINDYITAIYFDKRGNKWIGTSCGLCMNDGSRWISFNDNVFKEKTSQGSEISVISDIAEDSTGNIWVLVRDKYSLSFKLLQYDGISWNSFSVSTKNYADFIESYDNYGKLAIDSKKNVWIGTYNDGLLKFDGKTFTKYYSISQGGDYLGIESMTIDNYDDLLICTNDAGMNVDLENGLFKFNEKSLTKIRDAKRGKLFKDETGVIWESSEYDYADTTAVWKLKNNVWSELVTPAPTTENDDYIEYSFAQCGGNIWIARNQEFFIRNGNNWNDVQDSVMQNSIYYITEGEKGNLFGLVEASSDIYKFDGKNWLFFISPPENVYISDLKADRSNNLWLIGSVYGIFDQVECIATQIYKYDGNNWTISKAGASNIKYSNLFIDSKDYIYAVSNNSISKFDGKSWTSIPLPSQPAYGISQIATDSKGNIWISYADMTGEVAGTLVEYNGTEWKQILVPNYNGNNHDTTRNMPKNGFNFSIDKNDNIWLNTMSCQIIGGPSTILKYDGMSFNIIMNLGSGKDELTKSIFGTYTPQSSADEIIVDSSNYIWFRMHDGTLLQFTGKDWNLFDQKDGINPEVYTNCIIAGKGKNTIWYSTSSCLFEISEQIITLNLKSACLKKGGGIIRRVKSAETENTLSIIVSAADFRHIGKFQFALKFNPSRLIFVNASGYNLLGLSENNFNTFRANEGYIEVYLDNSNSWGQTLSDGTELFSLNFQTINPGDSNAPVTFVRDSINTRFESIYGKEIKYRLIGNDETFTDIQTPDDYTLNIFPNPVGEKLYILNSGEIARISIYDITGKLLKSEVLNNKNNAQINTSDLKSGVYFLTADLKNGRNKTLKLLKQ